MASIWLLIGLVLVILFLAIAYITKSGTLTGARGKLRGSLWPFDPRQQWLPNMGYCGETAFLCAGLKFGQYLSQFDIRAIAANGPQPTLDFHPGPPHKSGSCSLQQCQLLLYVNDSFTAGNLRLNYTAWADTDYEAFMVWIKQNVLAGAAVVIGMYENQCFFVDDSKCGSQYGDKVYDHIVLVEKVESTHPNDGKYYGDDVLYISDHGLWDYKDFHPFPPYSTQQPPPQYPQYIYSARFDTVGANRKQANSGDTNALLYYICNTKVGQFGIALTGVQGSDAVPVSVSTQYNYENPPIVDGSNTRPAAMSETLTVTIPTLQAGKNYNLYRYDDETKVPTGNFNQYAAQAKQKYAITGGSSPWTMTIPIMTSDKVIFRCCAA